VYSAEPQMLRALIASNSHVQATFAAPAQYDADVKADIVVLDRFAPAVRPHADSIWIQPPAEGSPIPVRETKTALKLEHWRPETTLGAGLHTTNAQLDSGEILSAAPGDIVVADAAEGPLIVARPASPKLAVIGFQPLRSSMKYELATPLLMANLMRWMAPETFRRWDVQAGTVGTVEVALEKGTDPASVRVLTEDQRPLPFTIDGDSLRFFAGAPGTVRVVTGDREAVYSLTLPDVGDAPWKPPQNVRRGIPRASEAGAAGIDIWPWLAVLGGLGLLIDWLLFGRSRAFRLRAAKMMAKAPFAAFLKTAWRKAS